MRGGPRWEEDVVDLVAQVPPGRVLSYGDVAELLGRGSARGVGRTLQLAGYRTAWWRVVRADGGLHAPLRDRAGREHEREGTPRRPDGRVDMARGRWDAQGLRPAVAAADEERATGGVEAARGTG